MSHSAAASNAPYIYRIGPRTSGPWGGSRQCKCVVSTPVLDAGSRRLLKGGDRTRTVACVRQQLGRVASLFRLLGRGRFAKRREPGGVVG